MKLAFYIFQESLVYVSDSFPRSRIFVVYIPSVVSSYQIVSSRVSIRNRIFPSDIVPKRSDLIKLITENQGFIFIDTRPTIKKSSRNRFVHGPRDWKHFNRSGCEALAEAILPYLNNID